MYTQKSGSLHSAVHLGNLLKKHEQYLQKLNITSTSNSTINNSISNSTSSNSTSSNSIINSTSSNSIINSTSSNSTSSNSIINNSISNNNSTINNSISNSTTTIRPPINTYIQTEPDKDIFALSDIHGDIHSLIIVLRDLAQVIRKKDGFPFDNNTYDSNLEELLNIEICNTDGAYIDDLNYEWIPGNESYIVIIGDIIDAYRGPAWGIQKNNSDDYEHQYPQIEIKLLRFINAINKQAVTYNGRIFKLFGNHEVLNILSTNRQDEYIFPSDRTKSNYYRGKSRDTVFHYDNEGYNLLLEDECRCLLMLNNYIFVHGQINFKNFKEFEDINNILNRSINKSEIIKIYIYLDGEESSLWSRYYGSHTYVDKHDENIVCTVLNDDFISLIENNSVIPYSNSDLKLVVGHCIQYTSSTNTTNPTKNTTFTNLESSNNIRQIISAPSESDYFNIQKNLIFGITMSCPNSARNEHKLFRVDIGSSRGFDNENHYNNIFSSTNKLDAEKQFIYSRTPQVLKIKNNVEQIIKSTIKNTRIHQPRYHYESEIINNPYDELKLDSGNYLKKYLKYKKKYLELKKLYN